VKRARSGKVKRRIVIPIAIGSETSVKRDEEEIS